MRFIELQVIYILKRYLNGIHNDLKRIQNNDKVLTSDD